VSEQEDILDYASEPDDDRFPYDVMAKAHDLRVLRDAKRIVAAEDRPPIRKPELVTLRERLARPRSPVQWRITGWQPADSRVMLAAQFKAGKTTVVANLERCLVDGDPFLGAHDVTTVDGSVVTIDLEMSAHQLDDWHTNQKIRNDDRVIVVPLRGSAAAFDILDPGIRTQWADMLKARGCGYLIVDCLRPVLDALGLDEHREAGRFLTSLDALLSEAGIPDAAVIHHMGHIAERSRGDSRIRDWPDVEWRLVREEDDPASPRYISAYGRDVDIEESLLTYDRTTRRLAIRGGSRREAAARAALTDVLGLLDNTEEPMSGNRIETALVGTDHAQKAIRAALKLGIRDGSITTSPGAKNAILHTSSSVRRSSSQFVAASSTKSSEFVSSSIDDELNSDNEHNPSSSPTKSCRACGEPTGNPDGFHLTCRSGEA
jgi:AAA domain